MFPDTKSIKKNVGNAIKQVNKYNPIMRIFKPKRRIVHRHIYSKTTRTPRKVVRYRSKSYSNPIRKYSRPIVNNVKRGVKRVGSTLRKIFRFR